MRKYHDFIKHIFDVDGIADPLLPRSCGYCREAIDAGTRYIAVTYNRRDGWVSNLTHMHPACAQSLPYIDTYRGAQSAHRDLTFPVPAV